MYGWVWSYQIEPTGSTTPAALDESVKLLDRDQHVGAAAVGAYAQISIAGKEIGAIAVESGRGVPVVEITNGRAPRTVDDLALGAETLRSLHRQVGDTVRVNIGGSTRQFNVVGQAVFARFAPYPASEPTGLGTGAAMTLAGLSRFGPLNSDSSVSPLAGGPFVLVDAVPGTDASLFERLAFHDNPDAGLVLAAQRPTVVQSYQQLERMQLLLAGLLVLLAVSTTYQLLASTVRRRRRDLALLRTLGFTSGQLRRSILVQSMTLMALSTAIAIPIGLIAGRWLWILTSDWLGIPERSLVPIGAVAIVALAALIIGAGIALVPARSASHVNPATALRGG
jgi:predicted lysophospholipase L1 biosynthesis ABC-type transport system permease subunit